MQNYNVGWANWLNERNNKEQLKFEIGTVVEVSPLKISIQNGAAYFTEDINLKVCETLKTMTGTIVINGVSQAFSIARDLNVNDEILCYPLNNKYYVAYDKV